MNISFECVAVLPPNILYESQKYSPLTKEYNMLYPLIHALKFPMIQKIVRNMINDLTFMTGTLILFN